MNTRVTSRHSGLKSRGARAEFQSWFGSVGLLEKTLLDGSTHLFAEPQQARSPTGIIDSADGSGASWKAKSGL